MELSAFSNQQSAYLDAELEEMGGLQRKKPGNRPAGLGNTPQIRRGLSVTVVSVLAVPLGRRLSSGSQMASACLRLQTGQFHQVALQSRLE